MIAHGPRNPAPRHAGERGSAYLLALLVLVILSLVGLSLALVTQTEQQIGTTEKEATRAMYAAESGVAVSTASVMATHDPLSRTITLNKRTSGQTEIADRVRISPFFQIATAPCNLCQVNQDKEIFQVIHAVTAWESRQARAVGALPNTPWDAELSASFLGTIITIQPWDPSIAALQQTVNDPLTKQLVRY